MGTPGLALLGEEIVSELHGVGIANPGHVMQHGFLFWTELRDLPFKLRPPHLHLWVDGLSRCDNLPMFLAPCIESRDEHAQHCNDHPHTLGDVAQVKHVVPEDENEGYERSAHEAAEVPSQGLQVDPEIARGHASRVTVTV